MKKVDLEEQERDLVPTLDAMLVIAATFVLVLFMGSFFFLVFGSGPALVLSELLILIVPLVYLLARRIDIKRFIGLKINPKLVVLGLASGVLLLFVNIIVSLMLTVIFGASQAVEESNALITELSSSTSGLLLVITALSLAGICEEFTFRGFLQNALTRRYSFIPAVIASSITFGLFHFDPQLVYIISAISAGLVLGYIYNHWNSYLVVAMAHSTVNIVVLFTLLLVP